MPRVREIPGPYRFFFYSFDCREPQHVQSVEVSDEMITAHLADGRVISVPLAWSWRLATATPAQRANYEIIGDGHGVHWPDVDEDISAEGMLAGSPAPRRT